MSNLAWTLTEFASLLLEPAERDAVLGDLVEAGETRWSILREVLGLVLRQIFPLRITRSWLAGVGVGLPACYLLMGVSASISCTYERLYRPNVVVTNWHWPTGHEGALLLFCHVLLLFAWSWAVGYVCAKLSRRALLLSAALSILLFFSCDFHIAPLPKTCVLLFVLPLVLGMFHGLQGKRVTPVPAWSLAVTMTGLMLFCWNSEALWILNWALLIPAWYLFAVALKPASKPSPGVSQVSA